MSNNDNDDTLSPLHFLRFCPLDQRHGFDTQPTSNHGVLARWLSCVRLQAQISILQCRLSTTMNNTNPIQPQRKNASWLRSFKNLPSLPPNFPPKAIFNQSKVETRVQITYSARTLQKLRPSWFSAIFFHVHYQQVITWFRVQFVVTSTTALCCFVVFEKFTHIALEIMLLLILIQKY